MEQPTKGGSYIRDPETGALTKVREDVDTATVNETASETPAEIAESEAPASSATKRGK